MDNSKISNLDVNNKKDVPPLDDEKEISTSRKHSMDYFTTDGVTLRTGYKSKLDWYLLPIREMLDNGTDFLWKYYKGSNNANIRVEVRMTDQIFGLKIQNSNERNIPVFQDLHSIFNYEIRYGSKQDVHIISRGMLGDAMKQILSLGYVLSHVGDDGTAFVDKQWKHPLIMRHNKKEWKIYLTVDKAAQLCKVICEPSSDEALHTDTEIELLLPVIDEIRNSLNRTYIEEFCRKYSLLTTDISFKFQIIDDITHNNTAEQELEDEEFNNSQKLIKVLSTVPEKGILNIDIPAIHPIASEWNNSDSIHSYKPEEFKSRITNVHDKKSTSVYNILKNFREGTNIQKDKDNSISIAELLLKHDRDLIIENLFRKLKEVLKAPKELALPYTTNPKKRCATLVERIAKLYEIDTSKKPSYKLVKGLHTDDNIRTLQYPTAFEIIAIPLKEPYGPDKKRYKPKAQEFIGAVNYSVSPKNNLFEGDYGYVKGMSPEDIMGLLRAFGFREYGAAYNKLPCVIVANLITPRRDPHSYDKSSIDTSPFTKLIILAIEKIAPEIQTYRAAGWSFSGRDDRYVSKHDINRKVNAKNLLEQFLIRERGLPRTRNNLLGEEEAE